MPAMRAVTDAVDTIRALAFVSRYSQEHASAMQEYPDKAAAKAVKAYFKCIDKLQKRERECLQQFNRAAASK